MRKLTCLILALGFSSFAQGACEPSSDGVSIDLKNVPVMEMAVSRETILQNCVSVADFIARHNIASRTATPARPTTPYSGGNRFNMTQNGKKMTADDFDAWMRANGIRVVGAKAPEKAPVVECVPTKKNPCPN